MDKTKLPLPFWQKGTLRSAGLGGFVWRDDAIKKELKRIHRYWTLSIATWALEALVFTVLVYLSINTSVIATLSLVVFAVTFIDDRHMYDVAKYAPSIVPLFIAPSFSVGVLGMGVSLLMSFLLRGDGLRLTQMMLCITLLLPLDSFMWIGLSVVAVIMIIFSVRFDQIGYYPWSRMHDGRESDEPIHLPMFTQRHSRRVLQESLRKKNDSISTRHYGSRAERVTGVALKRVPMSCTYHDIKLPGADNANIDHLLISPKGIFILDTKFYAGAIKKKDGKAVKTTGNSTQPLDSVVNQMKWAYEGISRQVKDLDVPVKVVVVVQHAEVEDDMVVCESNNNGPRVAFVQDRALHSIFEKFPDVLDGIAIQSAQDTLGSVVEKRRPVYSKDWSLRLG